MLQILSLKEMSCFGICCFGASVLHMGHAVSHQCPHGCAGAVAEPSHGIGTVLGQPH